MLRFQNDYSEGAHPNVLRALCDTNLSATPGYGLDDDCRRAADAIRARFACPDARRRHADEPARRDRVPAPVGGNGRSRHRSRQRA